MSWILMLIVVLLLVGAVPRWGYSNEWGYGPAGLLSLILVALVVLKLLGKM